MRRLVSVIAFCSREAEEEDSTDLACDPVVVEEEEENEESSSRGTGSDSSVPVGTILASSPATTSCGDADAWPLLMLPLP